MAMSEHQSQRLYASKSVRQDNTTAYQAKPSLVTFTSTPAPALPTKSPRRRSQSGGSSTLQLGSLLASHDLKRDPAIAPSVCAQATSTSSSSYSPVLPRSPATTIQDEAQDRKRRSKSPITRSKKLEKRTSGTTPNNGELRAESVQRVKSFRGINIDFPTASLEDFPSPNKLLFSRRGSMLQEGAGVVGLRGGEAEMDSSQNIGDSLKKDSRNHDGVRPDEHHPSVDTLHATVHRGRVLSAEEVGFSTKVRSMYEFGDEDATHWPQTSLSPSSDTLRDDALEVTALMDRDLPSPDLGAIPLQVGKARQPLANGDASRPLSTANRRISYMTRKPQELAGGIEDWEDVQGGDVDRYGFIQPKKIASKGFSGTSNPLPLQRVSSSLQKVSDSPRRKRHLRPRVTSRASRSAPPNTQNDASSIVSHRSISSTLHVNNLFRSRDRRVTDIASDMLTVHPALANIAEQEDTARKEREWRREEKWLKMAQPTAHNNTGAGMSFTFDTSDAKLISRTWKGIPDRWRATAWHAFLSTSARTRGLVDSDADLVGRFHALQDVSSADDVQIDVDVPRTINLHIMFRRRYRGGQRLLFRVLHAISLHYPDTGYVQGMASLAATLLCYYDEEGAFVMLARMWKLRGLEVLFGNGFGGLMDALSAFETEWLAAGGAWDVCERLRALGIDGTAYGTRWYLTLFGMSIPFAAQLRVWDVFMLLGDAAPIVGAAAGNKFAGADLDVLHATSAALVDATREVLLDSDFENAMTVLTSWIPVKDEDMLMRVAHAEWNMKKKRDRG